MSTLLASPPGSTARPAARPASGILRATVGRKAVMAVTGIVLFGFVVGHMVGNLQVYLGAEVLNAYGASLRELGHGGVLWLVRGVLLAALALHVWAAASLTLRSRAARPVRYRVWRSQESTYASRTMWLTGPFLLWFVVYHLMHFTIGNAHPDFVAGDVYHNVVAGFRQVSASAFYLAAMLALGLHLNHGVWSMLQTLGLSHPRYNRWRRAFAVGFAVLVVAGNISIPLAVLAGLVR